jgi:hypothetical protein
MNYFVIDTDWDENLNSPWDALWDDGPDGSLDCLGGSLSLSAIWKPPPVKLEKRTKRPDIYTFVLNYAVNERVCDLISPIVREEAEFLALDVAETGPLFVVHPLWPVDFDEDAEVSCNAVSGNITVVGKYSFTLDPDEYDGPRHLFRMRQARGSAARDAGFTLNSLIVSQEIKRLCEKNSIAGVVFKRVQRSEKSPKASRRTERRD